MHDHQTPGETARLTSGKRWIAAYAALYLGIGLIYPAITGEYALRAAFQKLGLIDTESVTLAGNDVAVPAPGCSDSTSESCSAARSR